jgi:hypothetical protein
MKFHIEKLNDLYSSPSTIRLIGGTCKTYKISVEKPGETIRETKA